MGICRLGRRVVSQLLLSAGICIVRSIVVVGEGWVGGAALICGKEVGES